jgi:hypothetical protein
LGRRLFAPASPPSQIVERLNQVAGTPRALAIVGALIAPAGTVLLDAVSTDTPSTLLNATAVDGAPGWRAAAVAGPAVSAARTLPQRPPINLKNDPDAPVWLRTGPKTFPDAPDFPDRFSDFLLMEGRVRAAATQVVNYINQRTALISDQPELPQLTATLATAQTLMTAALDPTRTLVVRASAQFVLPSAGDPLRPQIGAPVFTRPMSLALASQQMLPGVEAVPDETVALLVTNPRFVEAYMVGLNDEMRRELAWRQYPVISTATFFANFWGNSPDIPPIASWPPGASLGSNTDSSTAQAVLLVRGELLRRFPNTVITAVQATGTPAQRRLGTSETTPTFRGTIAPDMTFFGFPFSEATATAGLGYYFVLAEHPSEPRFGLAATVKETRSTLVDWNDLAWSQVTVINNHVSVAKPPAATGPGAAWGADAANQAYITYRQPTRVAFLATALLG